MTRILRPAGGMLRKSAAMLAIALVHLLCLAAFAGIAAHAPVIETLE